MSTLDINKNEIIIDGFYNLKFKIEDIDKVEDYSPPRNRL